MVNKKSSLLGASQVVKATSLKLSYGEWSGSILGKDQVYWGNNNVS
jgi:hypothetical protein